MRPRPVARLLPKRLRQSRIRLAAFCLCVLALLSGRASAQTVDQLASQIKGNGYVSDFAGVLSDAAKQQIPNVEVR